MPKLVQIIMQVRPTPHLVMHAQAILHRGGGLSIIWPQFLALILIGATLPPLSLARFRKMLGTLT